MSDYSKVKTLSIDEVIAMLQSIKNVAVSVEVDECISGSLSIFVLVKDEEEEDAPTSP
jgi:hypothetical protein